MDNEKREKQWVRFLLALFVAIAFLSMCSCASRIQYITKVQTDTLYLHSVKTDSVYVKDSIYIDRSGDTIYKEVWRWRYKEVAVHDTVKENHIDSIPYPVEVVKYVKKTNGFTLGCTIALFLLVLSMIAAIVWKRLK